VVLTLLLVRATRRQNGKANRIVRQARAAAQSDSYRGRAIPQDHRRRIFAEPAADRNAVRDRQPIRYSVRPAGSVQLGGVQIPVKITSIAKLEGSDPRPRTAEFTFHDFPVQKR